MRGPKNERTLVEADARQAMGFPSGVPGIPDSIFLPENFVFPVFDYDWGPEYDHYDATGNPTNAPPPIKRVIKMMVPKVDADGNELGGVPTVLRDAPLGTYLGWNITAGPDATTTAPFHAGQVCNYVGGMVPFAKTQGAAPRRRRSAPVARRALRHARRLRRGGEGGGGQRGVQGLSARRPAGRGDGREVHGARSRRDFPTTGRFWSTRRSPATFAISRAMEGSAPRKCRGGGTAGRTLT